MKAAKLTSLSSILIRVLLISATTAALYPPCPCENYIVNTTGHSFPDLFLYTNGRCYSSTKYYHTYASAQNRCMLDNAPYAGRSATFDSGADYLAVTNMLNTPGSGPNAAWIGLINQQWDDPNSPSCPPQLNVTQFQIDAGVTIPVSGTVGVGKSWTTWTADSGSLQYHLCEFGKNVC